MTGTAIAFSDTEGAIFLYGRKKNVTSRENIRTYHAVLDRKRKETSCEDEQKGDDAKKWRLMCRISLERVGIMDWED
jgi:hypothetical protein